MPEPVRGPAVQPERVEDVLPVRPVSISRAVTDDATLIGGPNHGSGADGSSPETASR